MEYGHEGPCSHAHDDDWSAEVDKKIADGVDQHGYYVVGVGAGTETPAFYYSIGFYKGYNHPELVVTGLNPPDAHGLIAVCFHLVSKEGRRFTDGMESDEVANMPVRFRLTQPDPVEMPFTFCDRYYKHFVPRLQLVWPDPEGAFPGDPKCERKMSAVQVIT